MYRIFLSSTAIDLTEHRQKVKDAMLSMEKLPIAMEFFGAKPNEPVEVCKQKVRESDALCVFLAHRYGWVPSEEVGGDGERSMTWIEVDTALEAEIPVFAFLVDPEHPWTQPKEQDLLLQAEEDVDIIKVGKKVKALKKFRAYLEEKAGLTRDTFSTPDDLKAKVIASLANFAPKGGARQVHNPVFRPHKAIYREIHPLQPATHFRGRKELLEDFTAWWKDPLSPDRVRSLIAIGGTGKTAFIEHFLVNSIDKNNLKGSVLVWSFYANPKTDDFLEAALEVFEDNAGKDIGPGGRLPRLQRVLAEGDRPHLLVLDGMELIQNEGGKGRARGDLSDHRMKSLLLSIAKGLGRTRVLITTRFKLTDLEALEHKGYLGTNLEILDSEGAISLLQAWGVKGEEEKFHSLAESVGFHALSVSVLGSYLKNYCQGDPKGAEEFELEDASIDNRQAAKLARILNGYAKSLPQNERDLLIRLSLFPNGISVEVLRYIIGAGGEIAGALVGLKGAKLLRIAKRLESLGLVYAYGQSKNVIYTAHPFLREYFRGLLGIAPEDIHEVVRGKLAIDLDTKPASKPTDIKSLDKYEALIEQSILAGRMNDANNLYYDVMCGSAGNNHLYHKLGDYGRIIRVLRGFTKDGQPDTLGKGLSEGDRSYLINNWGLAAQALGDLSLAEVCFETYIESRRRSEDWNNLSQGLQNSGWLAMNQGIFPEAEKLLLEAIKYVSESDSYRRRYNYSYLGSIYHCLGAIQKASENFEIATKIEGQSLSSLAGIYQAEHLFCLGKQEKAIRITTKNLSQAKSYGWSNIISICHILLGSFALSDSIKISQEHLIEARKWGNQSGNMQLIIRCHKLGAEIAICTGDHTGAISEASLGLSQAESCGYGKFAIDLLIQLAKIHLAIPDPGKALPYARRALDWASKAEVSYAWGIADATELCGQAHKELGEHELAKRRFKEAEIARAPLHL